MHSILNPFHDMTPLEAHGEELLELLVHKAPHAEWMIWLHALLLVAASADNIDVFRRLLALCENNPESWAGDGRIAELVEHTAQYGCAGVLSALLELAFARTAVREVRAEISPPSAHYCAAKNGHRSCVALLIKAGAALEYKGRMGGTALTAAVRGGHEGVVLELLAAGADVHNISAQYDVLIFSNMYSQYTPPGIAADRNNERVVDILLAAGADFGKNRTYPLPVMIAAQEGSCASLKRLLEVGADVNVVNPSGQSALHVACVHSRERAVSLLLRHDASLAWRCDDGGDSPHDVVAQ